MSKKTIISITIALLILLINLSFGIPRLERYSAVDEPYWTYDRTPDFYRALKEQKWKRTKINDKPGITVAAISGLGLPFVDPMSYDSIRQEPKTQDQANEIKKINFSLRLPIYLTTIALLFIFFLLTRKLFGDEIALTSLAFIGLSPIILGISLIINPDSLLWGFLPLSILSYLIYQKNGERKYIVLAGIFLGLSILTKYVANILYIYLFGLLFLEYIYTPQIEKKISTHLKKAMFDYAIIVGISLVTFYVLFPANWVDSEIILKGTIWSDAFKSTWKIFAGIIFLVLADIVLIKSKVSFFMIEILSKFKSLFKKFIGGVVLLQVIFVFYNIYTKMSVFDFEEIMSSPKGGKGFELMRFISQISADFYTLFLAITPFVLFFFCYAVFVNLIKRNKNSDESSCILYFSIFIILYYIASTVNHVGATIRYQIVIYPLVYIISAIGVYQLVKKVDLKKYTVQYLPIFLVIVISIFSLYKISPHYFSYASSLLPNKYVLNFKDMGDGSFEMAEFLNTLPDTQNLTIWSDKGAVCETFLGKCNVGFNKNNVEGFDFDYYVLSRGRQNRSSKLSSAFEDQKGFQKLYKSDEFDVFRINIDNRESNFVKITKSEKKLN